MLGWLGHRLSDLYPAASFASMPAGGSVMLLTLLGHELTNLLNPYDRVSHKERHSVVVMHELGVLDLESGGKCHWCSVRHVLVATKILRKGIGTSTLLSASQSLSADSKAEPLLPA